MSYTQMMYLQEAWGDDEWVPSAGAASSSQVPPQASIAHNTEAHLESSSSSPEETHADPTDSPSPWSSEDYRCMAVHQVGSFTVDSHAQVPEIPASTPHGARSIPAQGSGPVIGVPTSNPVAALSLEGNTRHEGVSVRRVDEHAFTPNVEELLENLQGPLEVVHNVSPAEVRRHLNKWKTAAKAELDTFDSMSVVRKFFGSQARAIWRDPNIEVIPGKAVCTVKPGERIRENLELSPAEILQRPRPSPSCMQEELELKV